MDLSGAGLQPVDSKKLASLSRTHFKLSFPNMLVGLTLTSLLFANIFYPIVKVEDAYSTIMFPVWFLLAMFYLFIRPKVRRPGFYGLFILLLLLSVGLGFIRILLEAGPVASFIHGASTSFFPKVTFLLLTYFFVSKVSRENSLRLFKIFSILFVATCVLAVVIMPLRTGDRFIVYEESAGLRFAGFHYELANFAFSGVISFLAFGIHWQLWKKFMLMFFIGLPLIMAVSLSNFIPPLALSLFLGFSMLKLRSVKLRAAAVIAVVLIGLGLIISLGSLKDLLQLLAFIFPRGGQQFSLEGSALFVRLYPMILSSDYFVTHFFSIPYGVGAAQLHRSLQDPLYQIAAGGITKFMADLVWLTIPILALGLGFLWRFVKRIDANRPEEQSIFLILLVCVFYIFFQPGFFNFTSWTAMLLCCRYVRLI